MRLDARITYHAFWVGRIVGPHLVRSGWKRCAIDGAASVPPPGVSKQAGLEFGRGPPVCPLEDHIRTTVPGISNVCGALVKSKETPSLQISLLPLYDIPIAILGIFVY